MIKNYFKIAWRNLWKNKTFTALNLGALSISLAVCLVIYFWINDQLSYDTSGTNFQRVFRVAWDMKTENQPVKQLAKTAPPLAHALQKDYSEIEKVVRIATSNPLIRVRDQNFFTSGFLYADSSFFEVFGYPLSKGDPHTALNDVSSVVISENIAKSYFGKTDPMGQIILLNDTMPLKVTGIAKAHSAKNHFQFDIVAPMKIYEKQMGQRMNWWLLSGFYTYVLLRDASSSAAVNTKIADIIERYNARQNKEMGLTATHYLQPLKSIHLHSDLSDELSPNGSSKTLQIFTWVAIFLLLVACINYVNLTTATSFKRAKEIGMKKVCGALGRNLVLQFLGETILISIVACLLAVGISIALLPLFNKLAETNVYFTDHFSVLFMLRLLLYAIVLGIIAGSFPALYLSRINPVASFKKTYLQPGNSFSLRKLLVVSQFTITVVLIISTIVSLQQLKFMKSQDLGFTKEQVLKIALRNRTESLSKELLKTELAKNAGVLGVTTSSAIPGEGLGTAIVQPEGVPADRTQTISSLVVDYEFIDVYQIKIAAGRAFAKTFGTDSANFILNEAAVQEFGWGKAENAIGKGFKGAGREGKVIGVVKDAILIRCKKRYNLL